MADPHSSPDWLSIKRILGEALERPFDERMAFVADRCKGDGALAASVEKLLPDETASDGFLEGDAAQSLRQAEPKPGDTLGGYELGRVLGEGGMGRVFEATQERPHRTVALKVLRPGLLSDTAIQRFTWEAEVLGQLSHPAIAAVYEAGVETRKGGVAVSWFAMDKVEGAPLLAAVEDRALSRTARLELFCRVCDGVSHAHQRGVIHRDLKPDNVLVDGDNNPHILDFGIARAVDSEATQKTTAGDLLGTLAYMSPEQMGGKAHDVDVRSDVFSLGVLLYRMLTGKPPYDLKGLALPSMALKLAQEEATPASHYDRSLRGDLETILSTALASDRSRRYPSVDAFQNDVLAYLEDRPIGARPATAMYHLAKFARRHKALVGIALMSLLLLIAAVVGTNFGLNKAKKATASAETAALAAETERDRALASNRFIQNIFRAAEPAYGGRGMLVVDLLDTASLELETSQDLGGAVQGSLYQTLGETYLGIDEWEPAQSHLAAAAELLGEHVGPVNLDTLRARRVLVSAFLAGGDLDAAREEVDGINATLAAHLDLATIPVNEETVALVLLPKVLEGMLLWGEYRIEEAEPLFREIYEVESSVLPKDSDELDLALDDLIVALLHLDRYEEAEPYVLDSVATRGAKYPAAHPAVFLSKQHLASVLSGQGRFDEAIAIYEELIPVIKTVWGPRHRNTLGFRNNLAVEYSMVGRMDECYAIFQDLVKITREEFGPTHPLTLDRLASAGGAASQLKKYEEAQAYLEEVLANTGPETEGVDPTVRLVTLGNLAAALDGQGKFAEAVAMARESAAGYEALLGLDSARVLISRNNLAIHLMNAGEMQEAVNLAGATLELAREHLTGHPYVNFPFRMNYGRCLAGAERYAEAEVELLAVHVALEEDPGTPDPYKARIKEVLAETYGSWGKPEEAEKYLAE